MKSKINRKDPHSLEDNIDFVELIVRMMTAQVLDIELFADILSSCSNNGIFIKQGYFHDEDFSNYQQKIENRGTPLPVLYSSLTILEKEGIITAMKPGNSISRAKIVYFANPKAIEIHRQKTLRNILLGFDYIIRRHRKSIFKVVITNSDGDENIGTGFLLNSTFSSRSLVITNKHVVIDAVSIRLLCDSDEAESKEILVDKKNDIVFDKHNDIAAITLKDIDSSDALIPNTAPKILDEVVTLGYPAVPRTNDAYLVAHKGEINSFVKDYESKSYFLFSAKTSPGNSGGPIIDKTGRFVGIVTQNFFEENSFKEKGITPYHAGIPASEVVSFIEKKFPSRNRSGGFIRLTHNDSALLQ